MFQFICPIRDFVQKTDISLLPHFRISGVPLFICRDHLETYGGNGTVGVVRKYTCHKGAAESQTVSSIFPENVH